ncbi:MAG TPA: hypothetical protein VIV14_08450 [Gammaproteobacteria bacterium]
MISLSEIFPWMVRLAAWLLSATIGFAFLVNYWVPGAVFGIAVIVWHWADRRQLSAARALLFVVASTLNFALVLEIAQASLPSAPVFNLIEPSVLAGTVLLPVAHHYIFGLEWRRVVVAVPAIYLAAYATALVVDAVAIGAPWDRVVNPVAAWQLAYLLVTRSPLSRAAS